MDTSDVKEVLNTMFSTTEEARLKRCKPELVAIIRKALPVGGFKFKINETTRSLAQQQINVKKGVSWTLKSKHLPGKDGLSRAVDIVCYDENNKPVRST